MNDSTMLSTTAVTPTTHASRYLQQLAKHWSHKLEVEFTPVHATIHFPSGAVATLDAGEEALTSTIEASDAETLERMKQVLAEIQDGTFANKWIKENEDGRPWFNKVRADEQTQTLEEVGAKLRAMMPFLNPVTHKPQEQNAPV